MRDPGAIELFQGATPEWILPVVELLTRLGDVPLLIAIACLCYWFGGRERGGYTFALILGGLALLAGLKAIFALPRPPAELHLIATDSPGFPSGHAMGATVVYGAIALSFDRLSTRRRRLAVAGFLVAVVSLSRLVLGVHYPIDVVAGAAAGAAYLFVATRLARGEPLRAFGFAAAVAIVGLLAGVLSGATPFSACIGWICLDRDAFVAAVAATVALLSWTVVVDRPRVDGRIYGACLAPLFGLVLVAGTIDPGIGIRAGLAAVGTAAVLLLPVVRSR